MFGLFAAKGKREKLILWMRIVNAVFCSPGYSKLKQSY
jgi:hypothetical protein